MLPSQIPQAGFFAYPPFIPPIAEANDRLLFDITKDAEEIRQTIVNDLDSRLFSLGAEAGEIAGRINSNLERRLQSLEQAQTSLLNQQILAQQNQRISNGEPGPLPTPEELTATVSNLIVEALASVPQSIDVPGQTFEIPGQTITIPPQTIGGQEVVVHIGSISTFPTVGFPECPSGSSTYCYVIVLNESWVTVNGERIVTVPQTIRRVTRTQLIPQEPVIPGVNVPGQDLPVTIPGVTSPEITSTTEPQTVTTPAVSQPIPQPPQSQLAERKAAREQEEEEKSRETAAGKVKIPTKRYLPAGTYNWTIGRKTQQLRIVRGTTTDRPGTFTRVN